jgi:hypothetical protein
MKTFKKRAAKKRSINPCTVCGRPTPKTMLYRYGDLQGRPWGQIELFPCSDECMWQFVNDTRRRLGLDVVTTALYPRSTNLPDLLR